MLKYKFDTSVVTFMYRRERIKVGKKEELNILDLAFKHGCIDVLEFLYQERLFRRNEYLSRACDHLNLNQIPVSYAVVYGQTSALVWALDKFKSDADKMSNVDWRIILAANNGHLDIIKHLYQRLPHVLVPSNERYSWAICLGAAAGGHLDTLKWLLDTCPKVWCSMQDPALCYALAYGATNSGNLDVLRYLHKCDPQLIQCSLTSSPECRKRIEKMTWKQLGVLESGRNDNYVFCLQAVENGHLDILDWLLTTFQDLFNLGKDEDIVQKFVRTATSCGHLDILKYLHRNYWSSKSFDQLVKHGDTPVLELSNVHIAASHGRLDVLKWYLDTFPTVWQNLTVTGRDRNDILLMACNHLEVLKYLHDLPGVDFDFQRVYHSIPTGNTTMLGYAAYHGRLEIFQWLLDTFPDKWEFDLPRVVHAASIQTNVIALLRRLKLAYPRMELKFKDLHENGKVALFAIAHDGSVDNLEWAMRNIPGNWDLKIDCVGQTILHIAAEKGHLSFMQHIQRNYSKKVDFSQKDSGGNTPWTKAVANRQPSIMDWMFDTFPKKCDLGLDKTGYGPFHIAAEKGHLDLIKKMSGKERKRNDFLLQQNNKGWTVSHCAADAGHAHVLKWLIETYPEDWNKVKYTNDGMDVGSLAERKGRQNVLALLKEKFAYKSNDTTSGSRRKQRPNISKEDIIRHGENEFSRPGVKRTFQVISFRPYMYVANYQNLDWGE